MATGIAGKQILLANYGNTAVRAAANLPATAAGNIFNVVGGRVLITNLFGRVTTAIQNQACTLKFGVLSTATGAATDLCSATAITNAAVGTYAGFAAVAGAAIIGTFAPGSPRFIAQAGSIQITTSATNTGQMDWYCNYISLDGGYVVAA